MNAQLWAARSSRTKGGHNPPEVVKTCEVKNEQIKLVTSQLKSPEIRACNPGVSKFRQVVNFHFRQMKSFPILYFRLNQEVFLDWRSEEADWNDWLAVSQLV